MDIIENPEIGVLKKGNLAGIRVYKFEINKEEQGFAFKESEDEILRVVLGSHEHDHRQLGIYLN